MGAQMGAAVAYSAGYPKIQDPTRLALPYHDALPIKICGQRWCLMGSRGHSLLPVGPVPYTAGPGPA